MKNKKSDLAAKAAFVEELRQRGFENVNVVAAPADIVAEKDGKTWYFEIKKTSHNDRYFGAATLTEWVQAVKDPEHFRFVVAISADDRTLNIRLKILWGFRQCLPSRSFSTLTSAGRR